MKIFLIAFLSLINVHHGYSFLTSLSSNSILRIHHVPISYHNVGPPDTLRDLKIGDILHASRIRNDENTQETNTDFTIERVGYTPDIFCLRNILSPSECIQIQNMAKDSGMTRAETITENDVSSRKNCTVAWIPSSTGLGSASVLGSESGAVPNLLQNLIDIVSNVCLSQEIMMDKHVSVEDLQVLEYGIGGEFVLHHDGDLRIMTVIYYMNGVGGTYFPLARTSNDERDDPMLDPSSDIQMNEQEMEYNFFKTRREPENKSYKMDFGNVQPGNHGLLLYGAKSFVKEGKDNVSIPNNEHIAKIHQGDAVVFYNYREDGSTRLDWRSLHCGFPVSEEDGTKWIANHWFRVDDLI